MATTKKKSPTSKAAVKKTSTKAAVTKKTVAAKKAPVKKKTATKRAAAKKQAEMRSFRVAKDTAEFTGMRITRQTIYWIILVSFIIFAQLWILKLQIEVATLIDAQQMQLMNM